MLASNTIILLCYFKILNANAYPIYNYSITPHHLLSKILNTAWNTLYNLVLVYLSKFTSHLLLLLPTPVYATPYILYLDTLHLEIALI